jgi:hypothetical protein
MHRSLIGTRTIRGTQAVQKQRRTSLVDWDGRRARRLGAGKIIMSAWEDAKTPVQEVIFV